MTIDPKQADRHGRSGGHRVWFTSDNHFGHKNVLKYCSRPFGTVEDMDAAMIASWNHLVLPGDRVYHIGDFALTTVPRAIEIVKKLNGQKYLIFGNHDKVLRKSKEFLDQWIWARDLEQVEVEGQKIVLCHYALRTWAGMHRKTWQLHGHSHGSLKDEGGLQLDVGVDCQDYRPISFEEVREFMSARVFRAVDHHEEI